MTQLKQIYKCLICGNLIEVVGVGSGQLVCCGQPMQLMQEQNQEQGLEKHVPVLTKTKIGVLVKIGSVPHPMESNHYIVWIELIVGNQVFRQILQPGELPQAEFCLPITNLADIKAREYCTIHGLWKNNEKI